jgi:glycosyltransferase involved in cell wall biosynthesis
MKTNVSVIICVKDAEKYIGECVSSLLNQTFKDFEIVIIDDKSTNSTGDIIKKFGGKRIKYFRNERNRGIAITRNEKRQIERLRKFHPSNDSGGQLAWRRFL